MRQEAELERQNLKLKMEQEINELQAHLKIFETVDKYVDKRDQTNISWLTVDYELTKRCVFISIS